MIEKMYSRKKAIGAGAIGGIVAGFVMLAPMMGMMSMMNLPDDLFPKLIGLSMVRLWNLLPLLVQYFTFYQA